MHLLMQDETNSVKSHFIALIRRDSTHAKESHFTGELTELNDFKTTVNGVWSSLVLSLKLDRVTGCNNQVD